jgi:hypothetical protein
MLAVRSLDLTSIDPPASPPSWIDETFTSRYEGAQAEAAIHALVATGRPVYVTSLLAYQVPFFGQLMNLLRRGFRLQPVPLSAAPVEVYRIRERAVMR